MQTLMPPTACDEGMCVHVWRWVGSWNRQTDSKRSDGLTHALEPFRPLVFPPGSHTVKQAFQKQRRRWRVGLHAKPITGPSPQRRGLPCMR